MKSLILVCFLLVPIFQYVENAKILVVLPLKSPSHFVMFRELCEGLASKGHEVDLITPLEYKSNLPGLNVIPMEFPHIFSKFTDATLKQLRSFPIHTILPMVFADHMDVCEEYFKVEALKKLKNGGKKYDLLILEVFVGDCLFGYAHIFKAPVVSVTTSVDLPWGANRLGNPDNPSYIPNYFRGLIPEMTLYERLLNTFTLVQTKLAHQWFLRKQQRAAKRFFGDDLPPLNDLVSNSSLFLVNSHFSLHQARPKVPNFVEVGGLHIEEPKPLDKHFLDFLGNSKFIYFSLGSLVSSESIPLETMQNICDIFKDLKYKVIWKAEKSKLAKDLVIPENVLVTKWMPQLDILCHPNILLFITHNGLLGTQEAVYCGVPMMSIPSFADQFLNTKLMVSKGVAIEISIETASKQKIYTAMKELINNKKYKENAKKLSEQFKDRPRKPLEEAIYWIEYVMRHNGAPQLRSRSADLTWFQYYLVDVSLIIISFVAVSLTLLYVALKSVLKLICKKKKNIKQKSS